MCVRYSSSNDNSFDTSIESHESYTTTNGQYCTRCRSCVRCRWSSDSCARHCTRRILLSQTWVLRRQNRTDVLSKVFEHWILINTQCSNAFDRTGLIEISRKSSQVKFITIRLFNDLLEQRYSVTETQLCWYITRRTTKLKNLASMQGILGWQLNTRQTLEACNFAAFQVVYNIVHKFCIKSLCVQYIGEPI